MIIVNINPEETYARAAGLWQYDYGQVLRIQGLSLPPAIEIHFSLQETGGEAVPRIGITKDGVTDVVIPDFILDGAGAIEDYFAYAFIYLSDENSGQTEHRIEIGVKSRPKPEGYKGSGDDTMGAIMQAVNEIAAGKADGLDYKNSILRLMSGETELARVTISGGSGGGADAREIELQKSETAIQWRYVGEEEWNDLVDLVDLKGDPGKDGTDGITPHIGENGNWYLGETDTGVKAEAPSIDSTLTESGKAADAKITGEKISELKGDIGQLSEDIANISGGTYSSIEPKEDDIPKVFINGNIPTTKDDVLAELEYVSKTRQFKAYLEIKCQGDSSMAYPKKNFTIKMFSDEARTIKLKKEFKGWGEHNKFVLKANWIDHSHARNIVSAKLWGQIVASRSDYNSLPTGLKTSPNNGAIEGFPVKVYNNGTYQGIYTWNIPKEDWLYGVNGDDANQFVLYGQHNTNGTYAETANNFRALWDGVSQSEGQWEVEVGTNSDIVKTALNNVISLCMNADDVTFKNTLNNYLDVQSALDYYIFCYTICALDSLAQNMILVSYDGTKLYCSAYDLDSTFGLWWNGQSFVSASYRCPEDYQEPYSLLWERIEKLYVEELKARYLELRNSVLSLSNMFTQFERFMDIIGLDLYAEDLSVYSGIPSGSTNNIKQIRNYIRDRLLYVDGEFENIGKEEPDTPDVPEDVTLTSISAVYSGGDVAVGTALNSLTGITVTATYSDGTTANVTGYTLVGEIGEGSNTITVSYGGLTTTFIVNGIADGYAWSASAAYSIENGEEVSGDSYVSRKFADVEQGYLYQLSTVDSSTYDWKYVNVYTEEGEFVEVFHSSSGLTVDANIYEWKNGAKVKFKAHPASANANNPTEQLAFINTGKRWTNTPKFGFNTSTGEVKTGDQYIILYSIPVTEGTWKCANANGATFKYKNIYKYDSAGNYVGASNGGVTTGDETHEIESGVAFVRIAVYASASTDNDPTNQITFTKVS